ncbi:MAG: Gfo/Idh/MocA family oxidoreductase, partial [Chitinophagaceae bacterium]
YYTSAAELINDPEVNAIYVATPPNTHEAFTLAAMAARKPVYVEKPMALNQQEAYNMMQFSRQSGIKLCIAHYRRQQPYFKKAKEILQSGTLGTIMNVSLKFYRQPLDAQQISQPKTQWRLQPSISGGGLFHDLAPHQLDLLLYFFGKPLAATGFASRHSRLYNADDTVSGHAVFENNIHFTGNWCFSVSEGEDTDECVILGSKGSIKLSVFNQQQLIINTNGDEQTIVFNALPHVQQPMIAAVVQYFLGNGKNPCDAEQGYEVMKLIDAFTRKNSGA